MAKKQVQDVIVQSALRVTFTLDFPITDPSEIEDIQKRLDEEEFYTLLGDYCYQTKKSNAKLVVLSTPINTGE